jgi:hypothetical protein
VLNLERRLSAMEYLSRMVPPDKDQICGKEFAGLLYGLKVEVMKCSLLGFEFVSNSDILQCLVPYNCWN